MRRLRRFAPLFAVMLFLISCSDKEGTRTEINLLGTTCTVTLYDRRPEPVLDAAFERIRDIDWRMKYTGTESEVVALNRSAGGEGVRLSESTLEVLNRGLYFSELGDGSFDITIGPLVSLWGIGKDVEGEVPPKAEIEAALELIDYRRVLVNGDLVSLEDPGMSVDLGGIAKGYAADELVEIFEAENVEHALINLGGNVYAHGTKPDGSQWRIGVQDPESNRGAYLGVLSVSDRAVVTSGPYERFFIQDGKRYHHILDTESGYPVENGVSSVTIVAENSMDADALSTTIFVLGPEKGIELIEGLDGVEALVITTDKLLHPSSGFMESFSLTDEEYRFAP